VPKAVDREEILAHNPHVNRDQLDEVQEVLRHLRERGVHRKGYDLAPRNVGLRASSKSASRTDRRLIRLTQAQDDD